MDSSKQGKPLYDPIFDQDLFYIDKDSQEVMELFYNSDSACGGTVEHNYFSFRHILNNYLEADGNPDAFWEHLYDDYYQECLDVGTDAEAFEQAKEEFSKPTAFGGMREDTMKEIICEILQTLLEKINTETGE